MTTARKILEVIDAEWDKIPNRQGSFDFPDVDETRELTKGRYKRSVLEVLRRILPWSVYSLYVGITEEDL